MRSLRVLIVDGEAPARARIRQLLQAEPDADVVGECANGVEAVAAVHAHRPDVLCLDTELPRLDGFGVLASLADAPPPRVLFVTGCEAHAVRAFDVQAVDYVLKPVERERFRLAFARVRQAHAVAMPARIAADRVAPGPPAFATRFLVRQDGRMVFVKVGDVDWMEASRNYVRLHAGSTVHTIRERISHLEHTLDPGTFARIHRSTIVNLDRVRELQPWTSGDSVVVLESGARLRLSRHYREQVQRQIGGQP